MVRNAEERDVKFCCPSTHKYLRLIAVLAAFRLLRMTVNVLAVKSNTFSCAISERRLRNFVKHTAEYVFSSS
jgi:hypothetical protein